MESAEQVNTIVNNLADKIGITAEKLLPVADRMIEEIRSFNLVRAGGFVVAASAVVIINFVICSHLKKIDDDEVKKGGLIASSVICGGLFLIFSIIGFSYFANSFQPTVILLEKLK